MLATIAIKRGLEASRTGITPAAGELLWTTDGHQLYVGDGSTAGGISVLSHVAANYLLKSQLDDTAGNGDTDKIWSADKVFNEIDGIKSDYIPSSEKGANNGVATLGPDGKLPASQLHALAITDTYTVATVADLTGLNGGAASGNGGIHRGDVGIVTGTSETYIANADGGLAAGDWSKLATPAGGVTSVNGDTGPDVVLTTSNLAEGTNLYFTDARADARVVSHIDDSAGTGDTQKLLSADKITELVNAGVGAIGFTDLTDTPAAYGGANYLVRTNDTNNGIEFVDASTIDGGTF